MCAFMPRSMSPSALTRRSAAAANAMRQARGRRRGRRPPAVERVEVEGGEHRVEVGHEGRRAIPVGAHAGAHLAREVAVHQRERGEVVAA